VGGRQRLTFLYRDRAAGFCFVEFCSNLQFGLLSQAVPVEDLGKPDIPNTTRHLARCCFRPLRTTCP
jgi:hypothetical protein